MKKIALLFVSVILASATMAQTEEVRVQQFNLEDGLAIKGYDPVAYFTKNKAVEGKRKWKYKYEGVTYYFTDSTNRAIFTKSPKNYEPQYGGWCAYSISNLNEKEESDPETFKILNGKLYFFYHTVAINTLKKWNKNEERLKALGDINWTAMFR
ncbi:MAG: YHS domain protein [Deinococcales bacterium]|nr:YHS domain protein [Chitinophagaceae bacterium]